MLHRRESPDRAALTRHPEKIEDYPLTFLQVMNYRRLRKDEEKLNSVHI